MHLNSKKLRNILLITGGIFSLVGLAWGYSQRAECGGSSPVLGFGLIPNLQRFNNEVGEQVCLQEALNSPSTFATIAGLLLLLAGVFVLVRTNPGLGGRMACPSCAELVRKEAMKCRYCGTDLQNQGTPVDGSIQAKEDTRTSEALESGATPSNDPDTHLVVSKKPMIWAAGGGVLILVIGLGIASTLGLGNVPPTYKTSGQCGTLDQHICPEDFPIEVSNAVSQLEAGGFQCENPHVYPDVPTETLGSDVSEIQYSNLTCNYYWNSEDDYYFGDEFEIFETSEELETHYAEMCPTNYDPLEWRIAPNVLLPWSPEMDQARADEFARIFAEYASAVYITEACDINPS